jgi:hypothetical protein
LTLTKDHRRIVCELRYHGEFGIEAQFLRDGGIAVARTFRRARSPSSGPRKNGERIEAEKNRYEQTC